MRNNGGEDVLHYEDPMLWVHLESSGQEICITKTSLPPQVQGSSQMMKQCCSSTGYSKERASLVTISSQNKLTVGHKSHFGRARSILQSEMCAACNWIGNKAPTIRQLAQQVDNSALNQSICGSQTDVACLKWRLGASPGCQL